MSCSHPVQQLRQEALELCGLSYERAFAVDEVDLTQEFGELAVTKLVEIFYARVYADPDDWFRSLFTSPMESNVQNLADYILQRVGVHSYYSERKGFPALSHRHMGVELTRRGAERWLDHMEEALEALPEEEARAASKAVLLDHLRYTAYFLVAAQNQQRHMGSLGSLYV